MEWQIFLFALCLAGASFALMRLAYLEKAESPPEGDGGNLHALMTFDYCLRHGYRIELHNINVITDHRSKVMVLVPLKDKTDGTKPSEMS